MPRDLLLFALWFTAITLGAYGVISMMTGRKSDATRRLRSVGDYMAPEEAAIDDKSASRKLPFGAEGQKLIGAFAESMRGVGSAKYRKRLAAQIVRAGKGTAGDVDTFFAKKVMFSALAGVLAFLVGRQLEWSVVFATIMVFGGMFGGFFLPDSQLDDQIKKRRFRVVRELPDVIDMLTISVSAGMGFEQAISKMVGSSTGEVASEFERLTQEVNAGAERRQAMTALADRIDVPELTTFISTVLQAESFGTPIAGVLKQQAADMRMRRRQAVEELAQKAPVKMTIPTMLLLLPASMLLLLGPAMMSLFSAFN